MKHNRLFLAIVFVFVAIVLSLPMIAVAQDDMPEAVTTTVHYFADASEVEGASASLTRYENGLVMALHTSDLNQDETYTVWWVVFNEPGNCSDACGENDIFIFEGDEPVLDENNNLVLNVEGVEAANISVLFASGAYVDDDGIGHFGGITGLGDRPGTIFGPGVVNPLTAEVHLVVRTHGPVVEGMFDAQITSFGGACGSTDNGLPCADLQFAVFLPPM